MDPVTLVVTALAAGAASALQDDAKDAVKAAYARLRDMLKGRFSGRRVGELALAEHEAAPGMWEPQLRAELAATGAESDTELVDAAQALLSPVILAGHSVGGMYARMYAARYPQAVAGMLLIESSHEGQRPLLNQVFTWKVKLEGLLFYPKVIFSGLAWRNGADRRSLLREWRAFNALTSADRPLAPGALGEKPLIVLTRADGGPYGGRQWELWHQFHVGQARLSANSRHILSGVADHNLHQGDPDLVISTAREVLRSVRTGIPLQAQGDTGNASPQS